MASSATSLHSNSSGIFETLVVAIRPMGVIQSANATRIWDEDREAGESNADR